MKCFANQQRWTEIFRQQVGICAYEYLRQSRSEPGRGLLHDTDPQAQLIADRVGDRNAGDVARAFRRHFGVTERQYPQGRLEVDTDAPAHV